MAMTTMLRPPAGVNITQNEPLRRHTTLHVGGPADWFLKVGMADGDAPLVAALRWAHDNGLPVTVIGGGSNILAADAGVAGLVVKLLTPRPVPTVDNADPDAPIVTGHGGMMMSGFAEECGERGLAGLAWAVGLPGTLGGAAANNAGAHGVEMSANVLDVTLVMLDGERRIVTRDELHYRYRHSAVKDGDLRGVLTTVRLRLSRGDADVLRREAAEHHEWRKTAQPRASSAGSMFQNPPGDAAGRLIDACGLKGTVIGDAQVSPVHANFLVNRGKATAADVLVLGELCRERVREQCGIDLRYEVQRIGRWDAGGEQA